ncbi:hypothetical protein ACO34A_03725 [Rhizobium sp. ACO-34A]|nr:hypothetical protein [Rhizobium sp. ACO-34A]ATN32909.1 hypothetical protein ACO34A_03725 [Rhizobium sp. ACO-34A]
MAADRNDICDWLSTLAATLVTDAIDAADVADRIAAAPDLDADAFAVEALALMRIIAESVTTPDGFDVIKAVTFDTTDTADAAAILLAVGLCIAGPRSGWISRPQARAARERIGTAGTEALALVSARGAVAVDLYVWLSRLVDVAVRLVSDQAADAVPVVRVETGISLPSTVLAYQIYGDAGRAESLVEIAGASTPMLMPVAFDALES